jgi:hypothetical protein
VANGMVYGNDEHQAHPAGRGSPLFERQIGFYLLNRELGLPLRWHLYRRALGGIKPRFVQTLTLYATCRALFLRQSQLPVFG